VAKVPPLAEAVQEISRRAMEDPELLRGVSILAPRMADHDEAEVRAAISLAPSRPDGLTT
jgi:hypothetical protein